MSSLQKPREKKFKFTSDEKRRKIIEMHLDKVPARQIEILLNVKKPTINHIIRSYKRTGRIETSVKFNHRPRKLNQSQEKEILTWLEKDRNLTLKDIVQLCLEKFTTSVSLQTVSRIITKMTGKTQKLLEVCVDSIESGIAAHSGRANRIELCSALSEGGLTPSLGTFVQLKKMINTHQTQIYVMLRPRRGTDFNYSEDEMEGILLDIEEFKQRGADGFVFGALIDGCKVDEPNCRRVVEAAGDLPVTFHRAFDVLPEKEILKITETIINLGFKRILTSGLQSTADKGLELIKVLNEKFGHRITIMPGSGINAENLGKIISESNCTEFHSSCREIKAIYTNPQIMDLMTNYVTDANIVKKLVKVLKAF